MTIAISLKVNDGVVLASDSASTLFGRPQQGTSEPGILNIYNNANKIFNLRKGLPIGAITWGSGSIGPASISTIIKDLRARFTVGEEQWRIVPDDYRLEDIAAKLKAYVFDELYVPTFRDWPEKPALGFIVAGYSSKSGMAEEYQIDIANGQCSDPRPLRAAEESGLTWSGQPEAITRLVMGFGTGLHKVLRDNLGVPEDQAGPATGVIARALQAPMVMPPMPIQDAIDLAEFLVDTTIKFSRFALGAPTVGGPIEVAAITKHEGFKWVRRKHYYSNALNPAAHVEKENG